MKKISKRWLLGTISTTIAATAIVPTTTILVKQNQDQKTSAYFFSNSFAKSTEPFLTAKNNTSIKELIQALINLYKELKDKITKELGEIHFDNVDNGINITLNITPTSKINRLTAAKISNLDIDKYLGLVQTILIQMDIIPANSKRVLTFKSLNVDKDQTSATYELDATWPNSSSPSTYSIKLTLNNLYPPEIQSSTIIATDKTQDSEAMTWLIAGIVGGVSAVILVAVLIYILFRKTRWEIENRR